MLYIPSDKSKISIYVEDYAMATLIFPDTNLHHVVPEGKKIDPKKRQRTKLQISDQPNIWFMPTNRLIKNELCSINFGHVFTVTKYKIKLFEIKK